MNKRISRLLAAWKKPTPETFSEYLSRTSVETFMRENRGEAEPLKKGCQVCGNRIRWKNSGVCSESCADAAYQVMLRLESMKVQPQEERNND